MLVLLVPIFVAVGVVDDDGDEHNGVVGGGVGGDLIILLFFGCFHFCYCGFVGFFCCLYHGI